MLACHTSTSTSNHIVGYTACTYNIPHQALSGAEIANSSAKSTAWIDAVPLPLTEQYVILQFLDSYKSVTLDSMAQSFGVSIAFIDNELAEFIVSGRLTAKIDKVAGVVETNR